MSVAGVPIVDHPVEYVFGLDLAKKRDWSALALLKRIPSGGEPGTDQFHLVNLARWRGDSYPAIVERVAGLASHTGLRPFVEREAHEESDGHMTPIRRTRNPIPKLAVDAGGVGAAVTDLLLTPRVLEVADVVPITLTGGERWSIGTWGDTGRTSYNVSKLDLVSLLVARMQAGLLKFRPGDPLSAALEEELRNFDLKLTKAGNATFEAAAGMHDDLVVAVGLALWLAERPKNIGWWGANPFLERPDDDARDRVVRRGRNLPRGGGAFAR